GHWPPTDRVTGPGPAAGHSRQIPPNPANQNPPSRVAGADVRRACRLGRPPPSFVFHGLERGFLRRVSPRDPSGPGHPLGFPSSLRSTAGRSHPVRRSSRVREPRRRSHLRDRGENLRPRAAAAGPLVVRRRRRGALCPFLLQEAEPYRAVAAVTSVCFALLLYFDVHRGSLPGTWAEDTRRALRREPRREPAVRD